MSASDGSFKEKYLPLVREAAAVIAAILIAFTIDAWWDARVTAQDARETLVSLDGELAENQVLLATAMEADRAFLAAVGAILGMDASTAQAMPADSAAGLIRPLFQYVTYNPSEGATASAMATGVLAEVDNLALRQAITGLQGLVEDLKEEIDLLWMGWGRFVDRGIETGVHASAVALFNGIGPQTVSTNGLLAAYAGDDTFRQILAQLAMTANGYLSELETLRAELDRTRGLIGEELNR